MGTKQAVCSWILALVLSTPFCAWAAGVLATEPNEPAADASPLQFLTRAKSGVPVPKYLGDVMDDLTYTPVTPCRLADTRVAGGPLSPRAPRAFSATQTSLIAAAAGG
jgi:hypothetical protein